MYLIAGLGNPGLKYSNTRHNIGFKVVNLWCKKLDTRFTGRRFQSKNARAVFQGREIMLLRPGMFMNKSGLSIKACADYFGLQTKKILVIHDDLDLPVGRIKVVKKGGAGGHKGVISIIEALGTNEFPRVKIGIGRPRFEESVEDYVLSPFYDDEKTVMKQVIRMGVRACEQFISNGIDTAMNLINCQIITSKEVLS